MKSAMLRSLRSLLYLLAVTVAQQSHWYLNATEDCGLDSTGMQDVTTALQACINRATTSGVPSIPIFFPSGQYLVCVQLSHPDHVLLDLQKPRKFTF